MSTQIRQRIVAECAWGVKNTVSIHYTQDLNARQQSLGRWKSHLTPLSTDCSGSTTDIFYTAGAPDPNGVDYRYIGNTATLYANAEHLALKELVAGDFIVCFKGTETEHVYIVVARYPSGDLKLFTHGEESTPAYENLSAVSAYWQSVGHLQGCRTLPLTDTPSYRWTVLTANKVLDHTKHPARYAIRHPRMFRKYRWIRFRRDVN
jgi:hypothetical protein